MAYSALVATPIVEWRWDWPREQQGHADHAVLELHAFPQDPQPIPSRVLRSLPERLAAELRGAGGVGASASVPADHGTAAAWAHIVEQRTWRRHDKASAGTLLGCRVAGIGQTSV